MKLPKLREVGEAVRALITGPYTSKFPAEPHVPHPNFRGQPKFNAEYCVGCLACEMVCPAGAIAHKDVVEGSRAYRIMIHYTDTCIFCGQCEAYCIAGHQGIKLSNDWELSFFDRRNDAYEFIEKPLQVCECCGAIIGCTDHLQWIARRLGELSYSSPTLYLSQLKGADIVDELAAPPRREEWRPDRFKILCARCRRRTTLDQDRRPKRMNGNGHDDGP